MKHKIYERILYEKYVSLNRGLDYINAIWGYGCPLGIDLASSEDLVISIKEYKPGPTPIRFLKKYGEAWFNHPECPISKPNIDKYKYDDRATYERFLQSVKYKMI